MNANKKLPLEYILRERLLKVDLPPVIFMIHGMVATKKIFSRLQMLCRQNI